MHSFDELIVNLMRLPRVWVDSGIREAQLGDALGHGGDGTRNGTSSDGLVGGSGREALPAAVEAIPGGKARRTWTRVWIGTPERVQGRSK